MAQPPRHNAQMGDADPPPETYLRVTDPGRFDLLHDAAEVLLDELTERYTVERRETREPFEGRADGPLVRIVRLIPRAPVAGPVAIGFTDFPGLTVRLGRWHELALPVCGCDTCDEDPKQLVDDLHREIYAHVEGGLWEGVRRRLHGSWWETRLVGPDFSQGRSGPLSGRQARAARHEGYAAAVRWAPWNRRAADPTEPPPLY
ncbi:DUF6226 family protein [Krasilnikovia sp. M28-CT-15]|uniref:DUF6226 family protein n=1 Tax=Krasilnikovia sp. M28-CT-15 TaxID=3373540 RepID=UPI00399CF59B